MIVLHELRLTIYRSLNAGSFSNSQTRGITRGLDFESVYTSPRFNFPAVI